MIVKPFRGLRPSPELSDRIPSPPYDVLSSAEARERAAADAHSFLHVIKPEIDLPENIDVYDEAVYAKGRENLDRFIERGWMRRDPTPSFYVYRLQWRDVVQTGIIGAAAVEDYDAGRIKLHEFTRPAKEQDRIRLNLALEAHPGPVFLTYRPDAALAASIRRVTSEAHTVQIEAEEVTHTLWVVDDDERAAIEKAFAAMPATYVADGHHRSAAAAKVRAAIEPERPGAGPEAPFRYFLAVHFPSDELKVLDYNRVVSGLNGLSAAELLHAAGEAGFDVAPLEGDPRPQQRRQFGLYVEGRWHRLTARPEIVPVDDPVRGLDLAVLTDRLLQPALGTGDPRTDPRFDFVGGIRGHEELKRRVDAVGDAAAFALYPVSLDEVMAVADSGAVMPPKSTWFEPKLRSGLVVQTFGDETL